jgi:hypothetical protein
VKPYLHSPYVFTEWYLVTFTELLKYLLPALVEMTVVSTRVQKLRVHTEWRKREADASSEKQE